MSDPRQSTDTQRAELAAAFGRDLDPLEEFQATFRQRDIDPFLLFEADVLETKDLGRRTLDGYHSTFRDWREFMDAQGRHPACPNEEHVKAFARFEMDEKGNAASTVTNKFQRLNTAYKYWQDDPAFPHPQDYNPFQLARSKLDLSDDGKKEPPRLPVEKLREVLSDVNHVRDRAVIACQLKLGLRATELCNIKLSEVTIENAELNRHYPEMGTHSALEEIQNAVYIPHDRDGNKSQRPRLLPLDDEIRRVLLRYLLTRPDNGSEWLFLSHTTYAQMHRDYVADIWEEAFQPEYDESENHAAVTSHFGRHRFTTYWRVERDLNRELIKYMRGDTAGAGNIQERGAIDEYIHTYYEDIEPTYRKNIYKLSV
ncbi:tyrosine-type recombinase/integrase [Haloarcula sp. KBTZ06]|uniref:tyrosine-type recombinase/integrase n=1 Tax=Haloarcula sp. KBTZ06 TaxID=3402682 RepID=UPI003B42A6E8